MNAVLEKPETEPTQGVWNVQRSLYHDDSRCLSNSALSDFRKSVPLFHGRHVTGKIPPRQTTEEMRLGTALHLMVLEPERFADEVAVAPEVDRRTKQGKFEWEAFCEDAGRKMVIDAEQYRRCERMATAVLSHRHARSIIAQPGSVEQAIRWRDEETGLWIRNLIDKRLDRSGIVVDLKSSSDPTPAGFAKSAANFGYHCQADLYSSGAFAVFGQKIEFVFIVVGSDEPFEVGVYLLDSEAIDLGNRLNRAALSDIARRIREDDWTSRYAHEIQTVSFPRWAFQQEIA